MNKHPPSIPAPQPVRHLPTLWRWLGIAAAVLLVYTTPRWPRHAPAEFTRAEAPVHARPSATPIATGAEFLALMIGKVGDDSDALSSDALREQLESLRASGAHAVRLEDVQALMQRGVRLPPKAVLIAFEDAGRETIEAADPVLASLGWPALAFVNVEGVAAGNINLVSRRRLEEMTLSGHWSVGLSACRGRVDDFGAQAYQQRAAALQSWTGQPVIAIGCNRWSGTADAIEHWTTALMQAGLPLGFVPHTTGVNRRGDLPSTLRVARIGPAEREPDALVRRAVALVPREQPLAQEFAGTPLDGGWVVSSGRARVDHGRLDFGADAGGAGMLTFAGSAQWRDERVEVDLDAAPAGQFWIYARHAGQRSFLRLGTVAHQVVLQRSDAAGRTRQLASIAVPAGPLRLALSVIGGRASATIGGQPLTDRPADVPAELTEGPVSLVVWSGEEHAAARISRIAMEPVARRIALLSSHPGDGSFERLRGIAGELWAVSPRRFRWHDRTGSEDAVEPAVEMLTGLYRVAMMPAVSVAQLPSGEEWLRLRTQMLAWADRPQFAGLNLVLERVGPEDFSRIEDLRAALADVGKDFIVTSADDTGDLETPHGLAWFTGPRSSGFVLATATAQRGPG